MYCSNCGNEIKDEELFCSKCGRVKQIKKIQFFGELKSSLYTRCIYVGTLAIMFIIRMLTQTTERRYGDGYWRATDVTFVPGNVKAIMLLLMAVSVFAIITIRNNLPETEKDNLVFRILSMVFYIFVGISMTFLEF